jgi:hypothetical protein
VGDRLAPLVRQSRGSLSELATDPSRGAALLGGSWWASLLQLACLCWLVLQAFGASVGIAAMGAVTPLLFAGSVVATTDPAKRTRLVSEPSPSPRRCHPGPSPST